MENDRLPVGLLAWGAQQLLESSLLQHLHWGSSVGRGSHDQVCQERMKYFTVGPFSQKSTGRLEGCESPSTLEKHTRISVQLLLLLLLSHIRRVQLCATP